MNGERQRRPVTAAPAVRGSRAAATTGLAHHLAGTAERVLSDCAPAYRIQAVTHALALVDQRVLTGA